MDLKLLFFGTPETAVPFLEACHREHEILGVVSRPDKPAGRGLGTKPPPVKLAAERLGLKVFQPEQPSSIDGEVRSLKADLAVVVAYGKILKPEVLSATRLGFMNVHFSLLPQYRGAAPIEWALLHGQTRSGVTLFWIDDGLDTGPVQSQKEVSIGPDEDVFALTSRLTEAGVAAMQEALGDISRGQVRKEPQTGTPSLAPKLTRQDAHARFDGPAVGIHNQARALKESPRAFIRLPGSVGLVKTSLDREDPRAEGSPGRIVRVERGRGVLVQCHPGRIWLEEVQPEGKRQIPAADFINGLRLKAGDILMSS